MEYAPPMANALAHLHRLAQQTVEFEATVPDTGRMCHPDEIPDCLYFVRAVALNPMGVVQGWIVPCVCAMELAAVLSLYAQDPQIIDCSYDPDPFLGSEPVLVRAQDRSLAIARAWLLIATGLGHEVSCEAHELAPVPGEEEYLSIILADLPAVKVILRHLAMPL